MADKVSDLMDVKLVAIAPSATIKSAVTLIKNSNIDLIPVVENGKLIGVIYEDDVLSYIEKFGTAAEKEQVKKISMPPFFTEANSKISDAAKVVIDNDLNRLPVVDSKKNMRCVGIVTSTELLLYAAKEKNPKKKK